MKRNNNQAKNLNENKRSEKNKFERRKFIKDSAIATAGIAFSPLVIKCNKTQKKPNIVFLLADQWRASATGYADNPNVKTPHLDHLAKESLNFRNAVSVCPVCTPYRASLMTGRYPTSTGMFLNDAHLPDSELCIAEVLRSNGYKTAYIGKWHLDGHGRKDYIPPERRQGFDYWKTAECDHNSTILIIIQEIRRRCDFGRGTMFLHKQKMPVNTSENTQKQITPLPYLYLMVHRISRTTPHRRSTKKNYPFEKIKLPANVPSEMEDLARKEAQGYYAHCEALDNSIGKLLTEIEKSGLKEKTILVFTSDHGEMLGSHGVRPTQKQVPWAESARVPFLIRYPEALGSRGRVFDLPLNTPDIFPTLLGFAGLTIPASVEGDDLSGIMERGQDDKSHAALYMAVAPFNRFAELRKEYRAVKTGQYTYVRGIDGPWMLYDDLKDPFQMDNLVGKPEHSALLKEMDERLSSLLEKVDDDFRPAASYIAEWGFDVDPERGHIPYKDHDQEPQTPMRISKNLR